MLKKFIIVDWGSCGFFIFLLLYSNLLFEYTTVYLFILLLVDILPFERMMLWTFSEFASIFRINHFESNFPVKWGEGGLQYVYLYILLFLKSIFFFFSGFNYTYDGSYLPVFSFDHFLFYCFCVSISFLSFSLFAFFFFIHLKIFFLRNL